MSASSGRGEKTWNSGVSIYIMSANTTYEKFYCILLILTQYLDMLPVYKAISIEQFSIQGGTTNPCVLSVVDGNDSPIGAYVVKVFKQSHLRNAQATTKEVLCNALAESFDLNVPKAALIEVSSFIIEQLVRTGNYDVREYKAGVYFGTQYIENIENHITDKHHRIMDAADVESIFAFDVLIRNTDRRIGKPNIFFKDGEPFLYDHELAFARNVTFFEAIENWQSVWHNFLDKGLKRKHIFIDQIKALHQKNAVRFDEFVEYLRTLNVNSLDSFVSQLTNTDNLVEDYTWIKQYLLEVKQNIVRFKQLLEDIING